MKKLALILGFLLVMVSPCFAVDAPPQVMMYYPADGQEVFVGQMIGLNATAISVVGVNRVAYFVNGACVCDALPSIECRYIIPVSNPQIEIHACAWDTKGVMAQSLPVYIHVTIPPDSQPPPVQPVLSPPKRFKRTP